MEPHCNKQFTWKRMLKKEVWAKNTKNASGCDGNVLTHFFLSAKKWKLPLMITSNKCCRWWIMKKKNSLGKIEFIVEHIVWAFIAMIWYKNILFRCLGQHTFFESKLILWGIVAASCLAGFCFEMKRKRNELSVFFNLISGYGVYTVLTYIQIRKTLIIISLSIVAALSAIYALIIMCRKIKNRKRFGNILCKRTIQIAFVTQRLLGLGLAVIIMVSGVNILFGSTIMKSTVDTASQANLCEQSLSSNIEMIAQLQEDAWCSLSVQDKLNVLQTVANVEQRYLGLSNELNVGAANLREGVMGYYSDKTHEIVIDIDSLLNDSSWEVLDTVCHEAYHSYQYRMVEAFNGADESSRNLKMFRKANSYAREFDNYISGEEDFCSYYYQDCESDARKYAEDAVYEYCRRINEYQLENQQQEN